jgi:hypothetical protein
MISLTSELESVQRFRPAYRMKAPKGPYGLRLALFEKEKGLGIEYVT